MDTQEAVVYIPNYKAKIGFFKTLVIMYKNVIRSKDLIFQLFKRDFTASYKKSFLGMTWILFAPIVGIVSWLILKRTGILNPGPVDGSYEAYVLIGSSIWGLFMGIYTSAAGTLDSGQGFIMQVKYPHEALLIKQLLQQIATFLITLVVNIIFLLIFGVLPSWTIILFPIVLLPLFFLGSSIGLMISIINVVAPDVTKIFNMLLGFVLYITPVIYSKDIPNQTLKNIIELNPLSYLITAGRDIILYGRIDNFDRYIVISIVTFLLFLLSLRIFFVSEDKVIEKMI